MMKFIYAAALLLLLYSPISSQQSSYQMDWVEINSAPMEFNSLTYIVNAFLGNSFILDGKSESFILTTSLFIDDKNITNVERDGENGLPDRYNLHQNYPNPFNPSTVVEFDLPKESAVRIDIINILGEKVNELINKVLPAGNYKFTWNAENLSSGIYLVNMQAKSGTTDKHYITSRKVLLLK
ncbi:MAG: T9SS type A sorting domain-containing protein [Melioribacteraceae bacterium]|nr:T9SS type A sorting domain-containing protein [Melioribacteraceae bacterium]